MITLSNKTIHLKGRDISYIMTVGEHGDLLHFHFGKKLGDREYSVPMKWSAWSPFTPEGYTLDSAPQEYPSYGYADLRPGAFSFIKGTVNGITQLKYKGAEVKQGAPVLPGMPCLHDDGSGTETVYITLADKEAGMEAVLAYTVFDGYNVIARSAVLRNISDQPVRLGSAYSACLELAKNDRELVYFPGGWARERQMERCELKSGMRVNIANERGGSGHNMNPFVMAADKNSDESHGEVYSMSLIYSGNHSTYAVCAQDGSVRILQGINPEGFEWELEPGGEFSTPQSVICFSDNGFGGISRELSRLYRNKLCRSSWTRRERPILINNWEATYFDFDEERLVTIAKKAKEAGIELFVMDDGWFGARNDDTKGLGDWTVNRSKLPSGLKGLSERINAEGLKFGLWIEPEMVNPDSELYRAHPDWAIHVPYKTPAQSRQQLILDISRSDVREYIIDAIKKVLSEGNIEYVKWDMNRPMTDMPYPGYNHRYTLGLYEIAEALTSAFPDILFEGCAGGGGRFDPGMLYYYPQIWTSDNSDAVARLKIQYATSMGYPVSAISAHVTASPNHQNGRVTPLKTRADVAFAGAFGYELDITKMDEDEFEEICRQTAFAKEIRKLVLEGDLYRLQSPFEGNYCAWEIVSPERDEVFVMSCKVLADTAYSEPYIRLEGIDEDAVYTDTISGKTYYGDELSRRGFMPEYEVKDFSTVTLHLKKDR